MNDINKTFFKNFLEIKAKLYHKNDENIKNYKEFKLNTDRDILRQELNSKKYNTDFLIKTHSYQRFDNYSWDWDIFIKLTNNYEEKFEKIFQEKTKLLNESILIEQEILDFKLDNFEDYYIYKYNDEKEYKDMQRKITKKSKGNVIFEWLEKDIISKKELKSILELQIKLLKKKSINILKKDINSIGFEFEFLTFHNNNPFYWNLLDIYDFILDFDFFKRDFYKDYPNIKNKNDKKINHYEFIKNLINHRFTNSYYNDYYFLASPIIDVIQDIEKQKKLLNKSKINDSTSTNYALEEIERLNKTLEIYNLKKKENKIIEKCFFKEDEDGGSYILTKWNAKNLTKVMWYSLKDKFSLTDKDYKKIKKSKFEISVKFLTY